MVIDTNVAAVAQGLHEGASDDCQISCIEFLTRAQQNGIICLDKGGLITQEYLKVLGATGRPGVGRAFVRWLIDHQFDETRVERVSLTSANDWRMFDEFPLDNDLKTFDPDDRKFVATATASALRPAIYNAADSDYADHAVALARHVQVMQLCG